MRGPFSFLKTSASSFDPATLTLTGWWRGSYSGSPWTGVASLGTSGGRTLTEATNPPATGAALNGCTSADFDGVNDILNGADALSTYGAAAAGSLAFLIYCDAQGVDTGTVRTNPALLADANVYFSVNVCASGVAATVYDGAWKETPYAACAASAWVLVQVRWNSTTLSIRTNNNAWQDVAAGAIGDATGAITLGQGNAGPFVDGKMLDIMTAQTALTTGDFDNIRGYCNTRYLLAL